MGYGEDFRCDYCLMDLPNRKDRVVRDAVTYCKAHAPVANTEVGLCGYPDFPCGTDDMGAVGVLKDAHGQLLGECRVVSMWPTPRSHISSHMYQIEVVYEGKTYTGRGAGHGMFWKGKVKGGAK